MIWLAAALIISQAATVAAFLLAADRREKRQDRQLDRLLQRIQAPQVAVAQFDPVEVDPVPYPVSDEEARVFHSEQDEIDAAMGRR